VDCSKDPREGQQIFTCSKPRFLVHEEGQGGDLLEYLDSHCGKQKNYIFWCYNG
jgi:hypothetical protein